MMSMWEYDQAARTAQEQATRASWNFPYNPVVFTKVEAQLLATELAKRETQH